MLSQNAVVQIALDVVGVGHVPGPAQQVIGQAHHVVYYAVLLVLVAEAGGELERRRPDLTGGLAAGTEIAAIGDGTTPVGLHDLAPALLAGHFVGARGPLRLWNRGVGVAIGQRVLPRQQPVEETRAVIPMDELQVFLLSRNAVQVGPDLQHPAGLDVEDVVQLFP